MDAFMEDALTAAKIALSNKEVPVGCIFVYNNKVIATGANLVNETKNATRHAELICIDKVLEYSIQHSLDSDKVFKEISVIVTVEPCIMCAAALDLLCVKEVIYGCKNDRFGGQTVLNVFEIVNSKITINGGVRADETMELLKVFYKGDNPSAPIGKARKLNS